MGSNPIGAAKMVTEFTTDERFEIGWHRLKMTGLSWCIVCTATVWMRCNNQNRILHCSFSWDERIGRKLSANVWAFSAERVTEELTQAMKESGYEIHGQV
jgi:hypothetical protein